MSFGGMLVRVAQSLPLAGKVLLNLERKFYLRHLQTIRSTVGKEAFKATNGIIAAGSFAGMRVDEHTSWGYDQYTTITGQYERELHPILSCARELDYEQYIDIGCANGYYAVGLAFSTRATVHAYDISAEARSATRRNAELNGVADRVTIACDATPAALAGHIRENGSCFLISDVEGAELDLLDPSVCSDLLQVDLLIELHGDVPVAMDEFARRFGATHGVYVVGRTSRSPFQDDLNLFRFEDDAWVAVSEGRGFLRDNWLFAVRLAMLDRYADVVNVPSVRRIEAV